MVLGSHASACECVDFGRVWSYRAVARNGSLETDLSPSLTAVRGYRADRVCCKGADFATGAARFASNLDRNGSDT